MTEGGWLDWPDCMNARDIGGLPIAAGGHTRPDALFRSDNHGRLTDAGISVVRSLGLSRIVDLRAETECAISPSPFRADSAYCNVPLLDPYESVEFPTLIEIYRSIVDRSAAHVSTAIGAVADAPPGPVLVHCHAGVDRTGIVVALLLSIAGVERDAVIADYTARRPTWEASFVGTLPATISATLDYVDQRYGGARDYLRTNGLTAVQLDALRSRLISESA
jgi:protein tyrosine/serine phosphatase